MFIEKDIEMLFSQGQVLFLVIFPISSIMYNSKFDTGMRKMREGGNEIIH